MATINTETWHDAIQIEIAKNSDPATAKVLSIYLQNLKEKHPDKSPAELLNLSEKVELHVLKHKAFLFPESDSNTSYINYKIHFPSKIPTQPTKDISETGFWEIGIKDGQFGENVWVGNFANRGALHRLVHLLQTVRDECDRILNFLQSYN